MKRITTIIATLVCCMILSGCLTTAFLVGAAAGGTAVYDRHNIETMSEDLVITRKIKSRVSHLNKKGRIVVSSFDHVVLLTGQLESETDRQSAQRLAEEVPNVKQIYNAIAVSGPISPLTQSSDTWVTTKIKSQMLATKGLHSTKIKVITENGTVYLMGLVSHPQADTAVEIARKVSGVQRVVKLFEYR